jgi:DNA-binding NtrC family response regulator
VLVVDDEKLIRWAVGETLADLGVCVEQADSAAAAVRTISAALRPFDLIVMDLRLPDVDDLTFLRTIRRSLPDTPIVVMTAYGTPEVIAEARGLGVREVFQKPFDLWELGRSVLDGTDGLERY